MNKKWILVHVICGIAEEVELFDSANEALIAEEINSKGANLEKDDFSVFSVDFATNKYSIGKLHHF